MKSMLTMAAVATFAAAGSAQVEPAKESGPAGLPSVEVLASRLGLDEAGILRIEKIYAEYQDRAFEAAKGGDEKVKPLRKEILGRLKETLTDEQKRKLDEIVMMDKLPPFGLPTIEAFKTTLNLNAMQVGHFERMYADCRQEIAAWEKKNRAAPLKPGADRDEAKPEPDRAGQATDPAYEKRFAEQSKTWRKELLVRLKEVLNDDQKKKFDEMVVEKPTAPLERPEDEPAGKPGRKD